MEPKFATKLNRHPASWRLLARPGIEDFKDFWMPVCTGMTVK